MKVTEIDAANACDIDDFVRLPYALYAKSSHWIPSLVTNEKARFKPGFSYYHHSEAAFFLVRDENGKAAGRLSVANDTKRNARLGTADAFIYCYESVNDDRVAEALFRAASDWAVAKNCNRLVGPKGFCAGDGLGMLIQGFRHRPAMGVPYNHAYYIHQWEEIGKMKKVVDYLSARAAKDVHEYNQRLQKIAERIRKRSKITVPLLKTKAAVRGRAHEIKNVYNEAYKNLWSYSPIDDYDLSLLLKKFMAICDPALMKFAYHESSLVGMQFAFPNITDALYRCRGKIWPFGWLHLALGRYRTRSFDVTVLGVAPRYQRSGINVLLYDQMIRSLYASKHYNFAEIVQIQEDNAHMLTELQKWVPCTIHKRHRVYAAPV